MSAFCSFFGKSYGSTISRSLEWTLHQRADFNKATKVNAYILRTKSINQLNVHRGKGALHMAASHHDEPDSLKGRGKIHLVHTLTASPSAAMCPQGSIIPFKNSAL